LTYSVINKLKSQASESIQILTAIILTVWHL